MFNGWNLSSRLTSIIILLALATNLILIYVFNYALNLRSTSYYSKAKDQILFSVENYYKVPLWNLDKKMIDEVSKGFLKNEIVMGVRIVDEVDQLISESTKDGIEFLNLENDKGIDTNLIEIRYNNNYLGKVKLIFSNKEYEKQNKIMIGRMILTILTFGLLLIFSVYFSLKRILQKPLNILLKAIQLSTVSNYEVRIKENFNSEFRILADEFNLAMEKIQKSESMLKEYNSYLASEVEARSKELDLKRAQMINSARLASLGEFSAGMAHEINNPLTVISGMARILNLFIKKGQIDSKYSEQVNKISEMSQRIDKIIKSLRTFARDGKNDEMAYFNLDKFLTDIATLTKIKLERNHIQFNIINNVNIANLYGQEVPISQVIINLINNAADAVNLLDEKWVKLEISKDDQFIIFKITDSGSGIPHHIREKMMLPFFTTKEVGKGTGLGLSISMGIMKQHKGQLFYNEESKNTQFILMLPLDLQDRIVRPESA